MLKSIIIRNFKSILELTLSLEYGEAKAPNGYHLMQTVPFLFSSGVRAVPVLGLFGANASGKSTIIQGLSVLRQLLDGHSNTLFHPNRLHQHCVITEFVVAGCVSELGTYEYFISYDGKEILSEKLVWEGRVLFERNLSYIQFKGIATKYYDVSRLEDIYHVECLDSAGHHIGCILSKIALHYAGLNSVISAVYQSLTSGMEIYDSNRFSSDEGLAVLRDSLSEKCDGRGAFSEIEVLLRRLDLGISRMEYHPEASGAISSEIRTFHRNVGGQEIQFNFAEESMGTRSAFGLLGVCLAALHTGRTLVIDEIDSSLHSLLVSEIVRLFKDRRYNQHNAQLVFTAHNTDLLEHELLRVSEVGIVNKTLKDGSTVKRLCEYGGVRNVTNFRKQYLEGRFSGIPFPYV